ncbi:MAG TPA: hypothetical protein VMR98_00825 [Candidatus Polarisedimenticolaceae bacterium]|nr:hypothetical protein [Candidatus Polarisedimenticolaceae bacterium]
MSKSKPASKFWIVAAGTYAIAMAAGLAASPLVSSYIGQRGADYADAARNSRSEGTKIGNYRLALALDPGNTGYRDALATLYIKQNNPEAAVSILGNTTGERVRKAGYQLSLGRYEQAMRSIASLNTPGAAVVRSKIALEQGSDEKAPQAVIKARNDSERLQLGISYAATDNTPAAVQVLSLMGQGEQKRRLERAESGGVALAQELYRVRLYRSAERVLVKTGDSSEKYLLLTYIRLELPTAGNDSRRSRLERAKDTLITGISRDPANLKLHELLTEIYLKLDDSSGAIRERQTLERLRSGKL